MANGREPLTLRRIFRPSAVVRFFGLCLAWVAALSAETTAASDSATPAKLRVVIIDGINNHDWSPTTAWLREFLVSSGRFDVDVSTTPARDAAADVWQAWRPEFTRYDVVLSNFNGGHRPEGVHWPREVEVAFENYVRGGGGFVSFHAANNSFPKWPAYEEMVGLLWRDPAHGPSVIIGDDEKPMIIAAGMGRKPGHGPRHDFQITTLATDHPITRGLPKRWMHPAEQLTHGQHGPDAVVRSGAFTFLSYAWSKDTNEREPMEWIRTYGTGRVYVTMLGHTWRNEENPNLHCAGFQTTLLRGVEWAATGNVTTPVPDDFPTATAVSLRAK